MGMCYSWKRTWNWMVDLVHWPEIGHAGNLACLLNQFCEHPILSMESYDLDSHCDGTIELFKMNGLRYVGKSSWSNFSVYNWILAQ